MPADRLEILKQFIESNPADCFARYGVAQEYLKRGEHESAIEQFQQILAINPAYQAAYFHAGKAYEKLGRNSEAIETFRKGIEVASRSGDMHAQSELQAALDELSSR